MKLEGYNDKCESCYMLGILPSREILSPIDKLSMDSETIFANIKIISMEPGIIEKEINLESESQYYIAIDDDQNINNPGYKYKGVSEKIEFWEEKLKDKIICFRPVFNIDSKNTGKITKNAIIEFVEPCEKDILNDEYIPIPVLNLGNKEFENKLINGDVIHLKHYNHSMYKPEYIVCGKYIYFNFQGWDEDPSEFDNWICSRKASKIEKLKIMQNDIEHIIVNDNFIFIRRSILMNIENNVSVVNIASGILEDSEYTNRDTLKNNGERSHTEIDFLDSLKDETLKAGLSYSIEDLVNLHTCVKTNPLTILAGMSGTGKSKLANIYSKTLNCTEEDETLLFLPINPSYTEPGDLLGYLNNTNGIYIPSNTGLVDLLNHANDNQDKMHIVIFDEMNLSQVEYWFAPFISLLELDSRDRKLHLYSSEANCINKHQYKHLIKITDNIRFIGTVNVDETTKDFSDRLLDRANIIILEKQLFAKLKEEILNFNKVILSETDKIQGYGNYKEYLSWINKDNWLNSYSDTEIQFFDELHEIINKYDTDKGISFRIIKKVGEYLNNIPRDDNRLLLDYSKAFDLQIKQRIITKLKGTEKQFGKLLGTINGYNIHESIDSELFDFFSREEWKDISDFALTKKEIIKKAKELGVYGYAN